MIVKRVMSGIQKEVEICRPSTKGYDESVLESSHPQPPSRQHSRNDGGSQSTEPSKVDLSFYVLNSFNTHDNLSKES